MKEHHRPSYRGRTAVAALAAIVVACLLTAILPASALAQPAGGPWSDDFTTSRRVAATDGTKVSGGAIELAEGQPNDLGEAVPGESAVYALVAVGEDVFSGTGSKGHLVRYDADKLYQEGYEGPSHYGVSSSNGQAIGEDTAVSALTTDGSKVFGGTSDGNVFSFDPSTEGNRPEDKGPCPGVTGEVMSGAYFDSKAFFGTSDGFVFSYDDSAGTFASLGQVNGTDPVTSMAAVGGSLFVGLVGGHVYEYAGVLPFTDIGSPDGTMVNALLASGTVLYAGLADGKVFSYDTSGPGPFADRGANGAASPVSALGAKSGVIFAGAANGHLYRGLDSWADEGTPLNSGGKPINALATSSDNVLYGGTGDDDAGSTGRLFRRGVDAYEDFGAPAGSGDVSSVAFFGKTLYAARGEHLYAFTAPGTFQDLGAPSAGTAINDIDARMGMVVLGLENGHLYTYNAPDHQGEFSDEGVPASPSPVRSVVAWSFSTVYVGLDDGRLMNGFDMVGSPLATLTGGTGVNDMCYKESTTGAPAGLYIAADDGKLFRYASGSLSGPLDDGDVTAARSVATFGNNVYVGHESGNIFLYGGSFSALGTLPTAVRSMAPAGNGVACGSAGGRLYIQEETGSLYDEGALPHPGAVLALCHTGTSVWSGSEGGFLASHDDANLGDLGPQVNRQIMIWSMTYDPGRDVFYAGTYTNAHFLIIDPNAASPQEMITDLGRPIPGEREIEDIIVTRDGAVIGSTYGGTESMYNPEGGHLFTYDPASGDFTDRGRAPAPDNNWWISSLVEGPESGTLVYAATSNSAVDATHQQGRLFSVDKLSWAKTDLGVPVTGEGTRSIARKDNAVFGATWVPNDDDQSSVYRYDVGGGFTVLGDAPSTEATMPNRHINRLMVLGTTVYAAQNNGYMFSFATTATPWGSTSIPVLGKPVPQSTSVYPLAAGPSDTVLCGTTCDQGEPGHLVSRDDSLEEFRDIDVSAVMGPNSQDRVATIAMQTAGNGGTMLCGTRGAFITPSAVERFTAHIFEVPAFRANTASTALSTVIDPRLEELDATFAGESAVGAVCAAPGDAKQVYVGTADGGSARLYRYNSMTDSMEPGDWDVGADDVRSLCPGPDGNVYIGTEDVAGASLKRFNTASETIETVDVGALLAGYRSIRALVTGPDGRVYIGAGDNNDPLRARLIAYDPATGQAATIDHCEPYSGRINGLAVSGTRVVVVAGSQPGGTSTAHGYSYTPGGSLVDEGVIGSEFTTSNVVSGPGGAVYCGTGPAGQLFMRSPGASPIWNVVPGWPATLAGKGVTALASTADTVYGCAGDDGSFFKYVPGTGFTDQGPMTVDNAGVTAATTDNLGKPFFGTTGSGAASSVKLVRYNPSAAFTWKTAGADTVVPPATSAAAGLRNVADSADVVAPPIGTMASPTLFTTSETSLRFKGTLQTTDSTVTPRITGWEVTWQVDAAIDLFVYPYTEGAYPGDTLMAWGSGFGSNPPEAVTIGGVTAAVNIWQEQFISVVVPTGAANNTIVVDPAGQGAAASSSFNLLSPPHVTSLSPTHARVGDSVEIHGTGFLDAKGDEESISFNGTAATSILSWSDTLIRARVPAGATSGPLAVSVNHHASNQVSFTVDGGGGPTVNITAPADGSALKGSVAVSATVQRSGGASPVELWADGALVALDPTAPYSFTWNADAVADGAHALMVRATDGYSRTGSDTITVYVDHTVPSSSTEWYFAEGCTDYGFETWVLIGNPQDEATVAHVTFMDSEGEAYRLACDLPPNSRTTVNAADVAPSKSVSVQVSADRAVVCERAMYWAGRIEGHDTVGSTALARDWYFAEGSTDWGFETFTLLGNPSDTAVRATLSYLFTDGSTKTTAHEIAPHSRVTVNAVEEVGARDFSIRVSAGAPGIVAERSMYHGGRRCGTNTIGCKEPSLTWYLSEGSTDWGFETWLLIQRPGAGNARVTASYRLDTGETVERVYNVKGNSRFTVDLATEVGVADVSTQVTSDVPVVCERSMYWSGRAAGHNTVGSPGPGKEWFLAEGCTDYGFETWVLLDNPSSSPVNATVAFLKEDGTTVPVTLELQPKARFSVNAADYVGAESFSTRVTSASPIMVERAMYWNGRSGGTGSVGAR